MPEFGDFLDLIKEGKIEEAQPALWLKRKGRGLVLELLCALLTQRMNVDTSPPTGTLAVNAACVHVYQRQQASNQKLSQL